LDHTFFSHLVVIWYYLLSCSKDLHFAAIHLQDGIDEVKEEKKDGQDAEGGEKVLGFTHVDWICCRKIDRKYSVLVWNTARLKLF